MAQRSQARPSRDYTAEEKDTLIGPGVTLNAMPATVHGRDHDFATVTRADRLSAEFAWGTIEHARRGTGALYT
ncbi:MAG: hypothetical protein WAX14_19215 [Rhodococcus sp. (in: high G+C Gram-positive bacteria)]|uniref:hypothetical protein n=1 Tax=Rhodococcus sp. TaxID=1831 RepID=UPI003BB65DDF